MSKKLTLSAIKESNKKYSQKKRVELSDGSHLFIYPHFSQPDQIELIKEIINNQAEAKNLGIKLEQINYSDWVLFNVVYKFADLGIPKDLKKKIQCFHELIKYDCYGEIVKAFPLESIQDFQETAVNFQNNLTAVLKNEGIELDEALEQVADITKEDTIVQ